MENLGSIHKLNVDASKSGLSEDTPMAINCEYGAFDNAHQILPRTKYDIMIDESSPKPGEQAFEKMSAGLYLGEIFRLAVIDLFNKGLIFEGGELGQLRDPYHLDTGFLSALEHESDETIKATFSKDLGITATHNDIRVSRELAIAIATRGARLCTTGIAALCRKKNLSSGHVAADGSVANKHPGFKRRWASALGEILDWPKDRENDPIIITSAEDGSGIGAAVIAAMAVNNFRDTRSLSS